MMRTSRPRRITRPRLRRSLTEQVPGVPGEGANRAEDKYRHTNCLDHFGDVANCLLVGHGDTVARPNRSGTLFSFASKTGPDATVLGVTEVEGVAKLLRSQPVRPASTTTPLDSQTPVEAEARSRGLGLSNGDP